MELIAYAIGQNPVGESKIRSIDLSKNMITKEGAKLIAPSLENNKYLITLDLSHTKIGVSGMVHLAESLLKNNTLKHLNVYRNIIDVDGARAIGNLLKVNTSLEFLDVGHNRIRKTGLTAICDGILANPSSKLTQLGIRSNFINDDGFTYLFDKLVTGDKIQLTQLFIKQNFLSEYHKIALATQLDKKGIVAYVDDFSTVDYLIKEKLDRTVWVSPMPKSQFKDIGGINQLFTKQECGFITDIRVASGRKVPGRGMENTYCMIEFADENSVPRALKYASKCKPSIGGTRFRIFKAGTQTAVIVPQ